MKKCAILFLLPLCLLLAACSSGEPGESKKTDVVDTSAVSQLARRRFDEVFQETEDCQIQEKAVYVEKADPEHVVVVFHYTSGGTGGDYGLEYRGNPQDGFRLLQEGAEVTGALLEASSALPSQN